MNSDLLPTTEHAPRRELLVFLLMLTVAVAVYRNTLSYGFQTFWDDAKYVVNNPAAHGFSWEHLKAAFTGFFVGNYAPLHIVSYMVDYSLWGLNPAGYTAHNIFLHSLNGYLIYLLLRRHSQALYPSVFAALLFVVHPVQVESVVWISQRKNVLAMLFFLLSLLCYAHGRSPSGALNRKTYTLSLLFFACALLTKSVAVVLPAALVLHDICISGKRLLKSIPDKVPFFAIALMTGIVALLSQSDEYGGGGRTGFHGGGAWATLLTMLPVFVSYMRMALLPANLSVVYAPQIRTGPDAQVLFALCAICALSAAGYCLYRRNRPVFFWYAFIPLAMLPVSQIIPLVTLMNDRYLYFPMLGIAACSGFLAQQLLDRTGGRRTGVVLACLTLVIALYGFAAVRRAEVWQNSLALWQDAADKQPASAVAWLMLGDISERGGDAAGALKYAEHAKGVCRGAECFHALEMLSTLYLKGGKSDKAEESANELIRLFPKSANGYILKGFHRYRQNDLLQAEQLFLTGVRLDPNQQSALTALGTIYLASGRPALAQEKLKAAQMLGNPSPQLFFSLAAAEALLHDPAAALNYLEQALRLGYRDSDQILKSSSLASVRTLPEFNRLMQGYFPGINAPKDRQP